MTVKTTVRLLLSVLVLGTAIVVLERSRSGQRKPRLQAERLLDLGDEDLSYLVIEQSGWRAECLKGRYGWTI